MHSRWWLLDLWNNRRKDEAKGRDAVHESMEVEYYRTRSQNHHLAVVWRIHILSFLCGHDWAKWCKHRCRSMSSSSKDTVDEHPCFLSKMKCHNNLRKCLDCCLATRTITSRLSSEYAKPQCTFSNKRSSHSHRISLILLHTFAKSLIALSISTSPGSRKPYCICIPLFTVIELHPQKILLCPLPDLWLSIYVIFVHYINRAFLSDTKPAMSSRGTRTRARTNEWDMTAQHAFRCLCDELKRSLNESGCLDDAKPISS